MWLIVYAFVALPIILYVLFELRVAKKKQLLSKLNGPPTLPFLGNAHQMGNSPAGNWNISIISLKSFESCWRTFNGSFNWLIAFSRIALWPMTQFCKIISRNAIRVKAFTNCQRAENSISVQTLFSHSLISSATAVARHNFANEHFFFLYFYCELRD